MLLAVVFLISQNYLNAVTELSITLRGNTQRVILEEEQQEWFVFSDVSFVVRNIREDKGSVVLEVADNMGSGAQILIEFGNNIIVDLETKEKTHSLEVYASKKENLDN